MLRDTRLLVKAGLAAIATFIAGMAIAKVFTTHQVAQQMAISESYLVKYQPQVTSATGKQINQLLAATGLLTIEHAVVSANSPQQQTVATALHQYFKTVNKLEVGPLPQLPTIITEHLTQEADNLKQLQALLQTQPSWAFDSVTMITPENGPKDDAPKDDAPKDAPSDGPHYDSIIALHSRLLAQSILAYQASNTSEQEAAFNAAINLTRSMVAHPSLTAHVLATVSAKAELAVARHTNLELTPVDYGTPLIKAADLDTHLWYARSVNTFRKKPLVALSGIGYQYLLALPFTDFLLLTQTNEQKLHNSFYQQLTPDNLCTVNGDTLPQSYAVTPYTVPLGVFHRSVANALSTELNTLIAEAKQTYRDTGNWPTILASADSQICPSVTWHYKVAEERFSITFDGAIPWLDKQNPPMPLSYTITSEEMRSQGKTALELKVLPENGTVSKGETLP